MAKGSLKHLSSQKLQRKKLKIIIISSFCVYIQCYKQTRPKNVTKFKFVKQNVYNNFYSNVITSSIRQKTTQDKDYMYMKYHLKFKTI